MKKKRVKKVKKIRQVTVKDLDEWAKRFKNQKTIDIGENVGC